MYKTIVDRRPWIVAARGRDDLTKRLGRARLVKSRRGPMLTAVMAFYCASVAISKELPSTMERSGAIKLSSCELPGIAQPARCGALYVPENPDRPNGRELAISVAVIPGTGGRSLADPIAVLMGGPGEDAIGAASIYARQFATLLKDRDLLFVDQRGTGRSEALRCDLYSSIDPAASLRDLFPPAAVQQCEHRLRAHADLTQYTYPRFASDLEHVRRALGYGPLNVFAGSYGTRAEQVFVRNFPQSVRTAYFGSAVPIDVATPLAMAKTAQSALEITFEACRADAACGTAFPKLNDEFREVFVRLQTGGVQVLIPGHAEILPLNRGRVAEWLRAKLYRPNSAAIIPWALHRAFMGDWSPITESILSDAANSDLSFGLFFAITCNDDVAFLREADIARETRDTFLGDDRVREQQAACRYWPKVSPTAIERMPVHSSVPSLFVTGDSDGGTPLWYSAHVAQGFPNRVEVIARGQGHTEWNDCLARLYERLVQNGSVEGLDGSSCPPVPRPPFKTD